MTNDSATGSHPSPNAIDIVTARTGDARLNETLMSDPIGADVGPMPPIDAVAGGQADTVAIGRPFISNPDLVRRWREAAPLNELQADKLYGGGAA